MVDVLNLAYGAILAAGGFLGYYKSGSTASLAAGGGTGAVVVLVSLLQSPYQHQVVMAISALLVGVMGKRFAKSRKVMPAGVIAGLRKIADHSLGMIDELVRATARSDWARARAILHTHWATTVPKVYAPSPSEPWIHSHDEAVIASELLVPIAAAFCNDPNTKEPSLSALNAEAGVGPDGRRPGQMCGRVFKNGEPTYSCRECALDPTCVLCYDCFRNSEHAKHKYRMSTSHGSGYCDCGDPEAWKSAPTCSLHEMNQDEAAAGSSLGTTIPEALQERLKGLTSLLLQYATTLVCWNHSTALPSSLISPRTDNSEPPQFLTVLFNDETHTFDAVIRALELAIHCSTNQAMLLATIVDREGRSCVRSGNQEICDRAKAEIQRRTARDVGRRTDNKNSPLEVRVMETSVVAHQSFAITLLTWLNAQTEQFPILSEVIGDVLLHAEEEPVEIDSTVASSVGANSGSSSSRSSSEPPSVVVPGSLPEESSMDEVSSLLGESFSTLDPLAITSKTLLVKMIREDRRLWKAVRSNFHQLLMKTVLMNFSQKEEFAKTFIELYEWIYHEFVNDDHEHDVSIVSLTVQFLTVPGIARRLVAKYDAIAVVSRALTNHCQEYIKSECS